MSVQNLREAYASIYTESDEFLSEDSKEYGVGGQAPSPGGVNPPQPKKPLSGTVDRNNPKNIETLKKQPPIQDSVDLFDIIKGHLLDEGYADTEESALVIMANMSEEWKQSIVEETLTKKLAK